MRLTYLFFLLLLSVTFNSLAQKSSYLSDTLKREKYLTELVDLLDMRVSGGTMLNYQDSTWLGWQKRTRELPPDFSQMPSIPLLPDPLIINEGFENIPIKTLEQWKQKREWIKEQYETWITGKFPPPPINLTANVLTDSIAENGVRIKHIELKFGPDHHASMSFKLFIPPSDKPLPVFMTQDNHEQWAFLAVRRGYIGCVYAGSDSKDDTHNYDEIYPDYDFCVLAQRAWGASRVLDYITQLEYVDPYKIAITGHSRNGKQSMIAAAFDDRFAAVIASTGSIGGGLPFRFTDNKYNSESIDDISQNFPHWFHPRMRFFMGREHKLPIDQNLLAALIAPRAFMFASGYLEATSNMVGMEEMLKSVSKVYSFLGENPSNKLFLRTRNGLHAISARDVEGYIDFLDRLFFKKDIPENTHNYVNYDFDSWNKKNKSKENYLKLGVDKSFISKNSELKDLKHQRSITQTNIKWLLGDEPPGIYNPGPVNLTNTRNVEDWVERLMSAKDVIENRYTGRMRICPYNTFGDYQFADLYYPISADKTPNMKNGKIPVVIFQHSYSTATGYRWRIAPFIHELTKNGIAVLAYDLVGFGSRVEEGTLFYERYPKWSKMGKMVSDLKAAVDAVSNFNILSPEQIYVAGNNLGTSVGLITAVLDERIKGVIGYSGFSPLKTTASSTLGIQEFSHYFGLIPKLGYLLDHVEQIPVDWPEIISALAPRNVCLIAPQLDRHLNIDDVKSMEEKVNQAFKLYDSKKFSIYYPHDFNLWKEKQQTDMAQKIVRTIKNEKND